MMTGLFFGAFIAFGLLMFSFAIGKENKREEREMSPSQLRAFDKLDKWVKCEYDPIIHPIQLKKQ